MIARRSGVEMEALRERIVAYMRRYPAPSRVVELAWHFRQDPKAFAHQLKVLMARGKVTRTMNGRYVIAEEALSGA